MSEDGEVHWSSMRTKPRKVKSANSFGFSGRTTISDLLKSLIKEESKRLAEFNIIHRPTIGDMYEGLTADNLQRAIPPNLNLQLVSGFITDGREKMTGQIDCMLVKGQGVQIPYTSSFKWHVKDVIAVFEVKKILYSAEMIDSFHHLRGVIDSYGSYLHYGPSSDSFNVSGVYRAFSQITGFVAPKYKQIESLPYELEMIFHILFMEQISPIRIVFGYDGFKLENSLRNAFNKFLQDNIGRYGFGPLNFPQLIISGNYSIIKINGNPYTLIIEDGWWNLLCTSSNNPIMLILELIWTRLQRDYSIAGLWGEDLELENFHEYLNARVTSEGNKTGWEYEYIVLSPELLISTPEYYDWEPTFLDMEQFVIVNNLCKGEREFSSNPGFISYIESSGRSVQEFVKSLQKTSLVALKGQELKLITEQCQCIILPDGRLAAAENSTGRLTRWLEKYMKSRKGMRSGLES